MTGLYGDSTRSVKAVGSEAIPGRPVAPPPVPAAAYHIPPDEDDSTRQLRPQVQSDMAATGIGAGRTRRRLGGFVVRVRHGGDHVGAAGARQAGRHAGRARRRLLPGAPLRGGISCAAGHHRHRSELRGHLRCRRRRRRGAGRDAVEPRPGRRRSAPAGDDVSRSRRDAASSTTPPRRRSGSSRLSLGADLVVASATKALSGHSDLLAGYVAGSHPDLMAAIERERLLAGPILGAFEAWLVLRSIGSAGLRFERQCQNALALALTLRSTSRRALGALSGPARRPVARGRQPADEALRRTRRGRARRRRGGARAGAAQRPAGRLDQLRWHPHLGGPPGPVGRPGRRRASPGSRRASRTPTTWSPTSNGAAAETAGRTR